MELPGGDSLEGSDDTPMNNPHIHTDIVRTSKYNNLLTFKTVLPSQCFLIYAIFRATHITYNINIIYTYINIYKRNKTQGTRLHVLLCAQTPKGSRIWHVLNSYKILVIPETVVKDGPF